jgi:hypothetical protein
VSWLNNQFKAVAVHRGVIGATWEYPGEPDGPADFGPLLREAVERTGYRGQTVSLLLAHPRLVQQLIDVPPVKGTAVQKIIQRQAQQQKLFTGEAAWACQSLLSGKGVERVVLHLFPKLLLEQLVLGCQRNGLYLTAVYPPSAVLHHQMSQLSLEDEEIAMLAAETGGSTTVVVGRGDGEMLLARTLASSWNDGAERLALDLNRTILFINQQYGVSVTKGIWLFGPGAEQQPPALQALIQLPVKISPVEENPFYWATEAVKLRPAHSPNFISAQMRHAPQRQVFARVVGAATAVLVLMAVGTSAYSFIQARAEVANIQLMRKEQTRLQARTDQLQQTSGDLNQKQRLVKLIIEDRPEPVAAWLLGYLSEACPSDLVVTNLHLKQDGALWMIQLSGTYQSSRPPTPANFSASVTKFATRLSSGPFHLALASGERDQDHTKSGLWPQTWGNKVTNLSPARISADNQFVIEGVMR